MTEMSGPQTINVPYPEAPEVSLKLQVGACKLIVRPGGEGFVSGTYTDPAKSLPVKIEQSGSEVRISQEFRVGRFFDRISGFFKEVPTFDLTIGTAKPFRLWIETGASEATLDLGGLPLTSLVSRHGAGKMDIDFSAPNPQVLNLIDLTSGAGSLTVLNLGNASFSELKLEGGAAGYVLDFGGAMQRRGHARITTGVASVELRIPDVLPARINPDHMFGHVDADKAFIEVDKYLVTQAAADGKPALLEIDVNVSLGSVQLRSL